MLFAFALLCNTLTHFVIVFVMDTVTHIDRRRFVSAGSDKRASEKNNGGGGQRSPTVP